MGLLKSTAHNLPRFHSTGFSRLKPVYTTIRHLVVQSIALQRPFMAFGNVPISTQKSCWLLFLSQHGFQIGKRLEGRCWQGGASVAAPCHVLELGMFVFVAVSAEQFPVAAIRGLSWWLLFL